MRIVNGLQEKAAKCADKLILAKISLQVLGIFPVGSQKIFPADSPQDFGKFVRQRRSNGYVNIERIRAGKRAHGIFDRVDFFQFNYDLPPRFAMEKAGALVLYILKRRFRRLICNFIWGVQFLNLVDDRFDKCSIRIRNAVLPYRPVWIEAGLNSLKFAILPFLAETAPVVVVVGAIFPYGPCAANGQHREHADEYRRPFPDAMRLGPKRGEAG